MNAQQWKEWNDQGLIPGADETEDDFGRRVTFCLNLKRHLAERTEITLPFKAEEEASRQALEEAFEETKELYGITPAWTPLFFNNYQLAPWHGGCAWIFQLDENTPTAAFLQLRSQFRTSPRYLGIYRRKELIAHELAHVGRMLYQEPQFEEVLAYQSSTSKWRRCFGPIVQSSKESLFFIILLGLAVIADLAALSAGPGLTVLAWCFQLAPLIIVLLALGRLLVGHRTLHHTLRGLTALYPPQQARHLLYRLRDSEIKRFATLSTPEIEAFIESSSLTSFRWLFLKTLYPPLDRS